MTPSDFESTFVVGNQAQEASRKMASIPWVKHLMFLMFMSVVSFLSESGKDSMSSEGSKGIGKAAERLLASSINLKLEC